jgi:Asp-tRNA(Asn)/Glu-tRNA(Gln) amidotransferase A subunit family amidase
MNAVVEQSAASLVASLHSGELTAVEVMRAHLKRIAEREATVSAFAYLALARAAAWLWRVRRRSGVLSACVS